MENFVSPNSFDENELTNQGTTLLEKGEFDSARLVFESVLEKNPNNIKALRGKLLADGKAKTVLHLTNPDFSESFCKLDLNKYQKANLPLWNDFLGKSSILQKIYAAFAAEEKRKQEIIDATPQLKDFIKHKGLMRWLTVLFVVSFIILVNVATEFLNIPVYWAFFILAVVHIAPIIWILTTIDANNRKAHLAAVEEHKKVIEDQQKVIDKIRRDHQACVNDIKETDKKIMEQ